MNTKKIDIVVSRFFRTSTNVVLLVSIFGFYACTKRPVLTSSDDGELRTEKEEAVSVVPTNPDKVRQAKTWESFGAERSTKVAKSKSKKESSWETGVSPSASGGRIRAAPKAEGKSLSLTDSVARSAAPMTPSIGFGGAAGKGKVGAKAEPRKLSKHYEQQSVSGILTAGSFDDADDIKVFERFWESSELASQNLSGLSKKKWSNLVQKASSRRHSALQLAFVVDTTGSMGDELEYLKNEFESIVSEINKSYPGVKKEYAFIAYRDDGDEYVTRGLNFTSQVNVVQEFIARQTANGGGDYPEAVHEALEEAYSRLDWSTQVTSARMIFHIADAPAHMNKMRNTFAAIEKLANAGIKVFPVAASGVMDTAEAMMRATALLTGGKYIFLTDDSGVGLPHAAPKHPCYEVEKLKDIIVREIKDRIAGSRSFPIASSIIRHGGDRSAGLCRTGKKVVGQW